MALLTRSRSQSGPSRLRVQTLTRLRWIAVAGQLAVVLGTHFGLGFPLPLMLCLIAIAASALLSIVLQIRFTARHRLSMTFGTGLLVFDMAQLGLLLYLTGGISNPFAFLLVGPVTVAAATLPLESNITLGVLTLTVAGLLTRYHWPLPWDPPGSFTLPPLYVAGMWASILCGLVFMSLYARRLAREAWQMSQALAATEHVLSREQRLHALDGLAAAAAHELGTPLGTITVVAKELERGLPPDSPMRDDIGLLRSQALRCRDILKTLSDRSGQGDTFHEHLPLSHLIEEAVEPFRVFEKHIAVTAGPAPGLEGTAAIEPVAGRKPGLVYGLTNLVENAVDFAGSRVDILAGWTADRVTITITDDGPGFPPAILGSLGDPYITTRATADRLASGEDLRGEGGGMGLGFFIAKTLLERSGAELDIANREAGETGAIVQVSWPRAKFQRVAEVAFDTM